MEKKALVVIDMQNDFITGKLGSAAAKEILPRVELKVEEYKKQGGDVIYTRDTHFENYMDTQEGKNLPVKHCVKGTDGWQIERSFSTKGSRVFDKFTFGSLELAEFIKEMKYTQVELAGLISSICVVSNALIIKATVPEVKIIVDSKCTAGIEKEDYDASLIVMKKCQIEVI